VTALADDARPRLARGVRLQEDKARGGFVLLAPERVLHANGTAVEVLRLCVDERRRIAAEVAALLTDLAAKRMVEL